MISTKRHVIMHHVKKSGIKYKDAIPQALEDYIKTRYKCTKYLARQVMTDLIQENAKENENL